MLGPPPWMSVQPLRAEREAVDEIEVDRRDAQAVAGAAVDTRPHPQPAEDVARLEEHAAEDLLGVDRPAAVEPDRRLRRRRRWQRHRAADNKVASAAIGVTADAPRSPALVPGPCSVSSPVDHSHLFVAVLQTAFQSTRCRRPNPREDSAMPAAAAPIALLYEDAALVIVDKPAGVPVIAGPGWSGRDLRAGAGRRPARAPAVGGAPPRSRHLGRAGLRRQRRGPSRLVAGLRASRCAQGLPGAGRGRAGPPAGVIDLAAARGAAGQDPSGHGRRSRRPRGRDRVPRAEASGAATAQACRSSRRCRTPGATIRSASTCAPSARRCSATSVYGRGAPAAAPRRRSRPAWRCTPAASTCRIRPTPRRVVAEAPWPPHLEPTSPRGSMRTGPRRRSS